MPTSLEQIPIERRATTTFAMPMKCRPAGAVLLVAPQQRKQVELMAYRNAGKGAAHVSKGEVQRHAQAQLSSVLVPADVPVGSSVAVKNAALADGATDELVVGEGTPFIVGDVVDFELQGKDVGGSEERAVVSRVLLHYRMPYAGEAPSNDPTKPWFAACLCRQKYNKSHERWIACKELRAKAVGSTSHAMETNAYVDWLPADRIFETQLEFNSGQTLKAETKRRLCQSDVAWKSKLGLAEAAHTKLVKPTSSGKRRRAS